MNHLFSYDGPLVRTMNTLVDYAWLNILTLFCSLPVVTIGASLTAAHVTIRKHSNEDSPITKTFFHSFGENFKQATLIWLLVLLNFCFAVFSLYMLKSYQADSLIVVKFLLLLDALFFALVAVWGFPLLATYNNTIKRTLINALTFTLGWFARSILMLILYLAPLFLLITLPGEIFPFYLVSGYILPAFLNYKLYTNVFRKFD